MEKKLTQKICLYNFFDIMFILIKLGDDYIFNYYCPGPSSVRYMSSAHRFFVNKIENAHNI